MVGGVSALMTMLVAINASTNVIWDNIGLEWFWSSLLLHFVTPALFGSYIFRALRLAVVFHPRVKRTLPWLIPVRHSLLSCLFFSTAVKMGKV